jgi:hypothetical protein
MEELDQRVHMCVCVRVHVCVHVCTCTHTQYLESDAVLSGNVGSIFHV